MRVISLSFLLIFLYMECKHLLFTKARKTSTNGLINGQLNPFVLACSSARARTRMNGWRMRKCWSCKPLILPDFSWFHAFMSLLPDAKCFSFFCLLTYLCNQSAPRIFFNHLCNKPMLAIHPGASQPECAKRTVHLWGTVYTNSEDSFWMQVVQKSLQLLSVIWLLYLITNG